MSELYPVRDHADGRRRLSLTQSHVGHLYTLRVRQGLNLQVKQHGTKQHQTGRCKRNGVEVVEVEVVAKRLRNQQTTLLGLTE